MPLVAESTQSAAVQQLDGNLSSETGPMLPSETPLVFDPATRQTILLSAIYLSTALAGVLACVYEARFGRLGLGVAVTSGAVLLATTALRSPILVPVALLGLLFTALAGRWNAGNAPTDSARRRLRRAGAYWLLGRQVRAP